jgi:hypothetical protein
MIEYLREILPEYKRYRSTQRYLRNFRQFSTAGIRSSEGKQVR